MNRILTGNPERSWHRLLMLIWPVLLVSLTGCEHLETLFCNGLLDPTQVGRFKKTSVTQGLRHQISINDEAYTVLPKNAIDPLPEDLAVRREDYRIIAGDQLFITVYDLLIPGREEQLVRQVSETGYISLPRLPRQDVAGKTEQEVQDQVVQAYREAGVLRDPVVAVIAQTRNNRRCYFLGPFRTPGAFTIPAVDFRLLSAFGMVGDLADTTIETVYVVRTENRDLRPAVAAPNAGDGAGPAAEPLPLPGAEPLPLPGGTGNGASTAPPAAAGPDIPQDLRGFNPQGLPTPPQPNVPTNGNGPAAPIVNHNGVAAPAAPRGERGHWMIVGGKWCFVPEPVATAPVNAVNGEVIEQPAPAGPATRVIRIDVGQLRRGEPRYNIVLRSEDVVVAPQPVVGEFYVIGNAARPGVYSLTGRQITLVQAIAAAGGFGPLADPTKIQLIRRISADQAETVTYDYSAIINARTEDVVLKPYDTINVGSNPLTPFLAVLRNAFRATYGVGFVYDRNFADIDSYSSRANPHN